MNTKYRINSNDKSKVKEKEKLKDVEKEGKNGPFSG